MEFISAEEFLKQPLEVQKVFLDWWEPSEGDIYSYIDLGERCKDCISQRNIDFFKRTCSEIEITLKEWLLKKRKNCIPLLTEGQVRKFIEDNIHAKIRIIPTNIGYRIMWLSEKLIDKCYEGNLLQVYWQVAVEIAKESFEK